MENSAIPNRIKKSKVNSIRLNLIFNVPEFIDLEYLKEKFKDCGLEEIEIFDKKELEGLISVPVKEINIKNALHEAKNKIANPIKDAIVNSGFATKIKDKIKERRATQSFIKWVQTTHKALKLNRISKQEVKDRIKLRFEDLFGKKGVDVIVNLFSQDQESILNSWAKLEDFFLQKLALEFYIFQQIRDASFVIVVVRSNDDEMKSLMMNSTRILVPITEDIEFYRRQINLPGGKSINNIYTHEKFQKVLMIFNPSKRTYSFVQRLMALRKTNSDLNFMTFMIENQNKILSENINNLEFDSEHIKNHKLDLDPKNLSYTIESLKYLIDSIYYIREDYIKPCIKISSKLRLI